MKQKQKDDVIYVTQIERSAVRVVLVGTTPMVCNRQSEKTKHDLLFPKGKKSSAEKAGSLKHDPLAEFRSSPHTFADNEALTLISIPAAAPKRALASAALDMPGARKAQIGRLAWIPGEYLPVFGVPKIFLAGVRNSDMNHTPDIRSRAIIPAWALRLTVEFASPILNPTTILNLMSAAGIYIGLGDGRNEKGALSYGQFEVLSEADAAKDSRCVEIFKQGRSVQVAAMANPVAYNAETEELLSWFEVTLKQRGKSLAASA
jgi:hypothetical protein